MHLDHRLWKLALERRLALFATVFLGACAGLLAVGQAAALSRIVDRVHMDRAALADLHGLLAILLIVLIARPVFSLLSDLTSQSLSERIKGHLRGELLDRFQSSESGSAGEENTGELANVLVEGIDALDAYFSQYLPGLALAFLVPLIILVAVLSVDFLSGVVLLLTGPLIPFFMVLIGNFSKKLTHLHWQTLNRLSGYFLDMIQGLPTLKVIGRSREQVSRIARASEEFRKTTMDVLRVTFLSALTLEMAATLSTAVIAVEIGLRLLYGRLAFEQALFVLLLAPEYYQPLRQLGSRFHAGIAGAEAAESIFGFLGSPKRNETSEASVENRPVAVPGLLTIADDHEKAGPLIRFENVCLEYKPGRIGLRNASFEIQKGEKLALIGPSGGGKSTVVSLLLRFIEPDRGQMLWFGKPISKMDVQQWREKISWVPQKPYLFNDTIEANLRIGRPSASKEDLTQAARLAQADGFIRSFPQGYSTVVGEGGVRLSAGEAQRIALARAFLKDAELIILDEATAHLDLENEAVLGEAIDRLLVGRTVLVVAHRLNTLKQADRVLVMDEGAICQSGSPEELLHDEGLFQQLMDPSQGHLPVCKPVEIACLQDHSFAADDSEDHPAQEDLQLFGSKQLEEGAPAWFRLFRLALSVWGWAFLAIVAGAATVLSGVSLMGFSAYIIAAAALQPSIAVLQVSIVAVRFFGISRGGFRYMERIISHQATFKLLRRLRVSFYAALEPLIPARLLDYRSGDLLSRIISDIQTLENFFVRALAPPMTALFSLAVVFVFLSSFAPVIGGAMLLYWLAAGLLAPAAGLLLGLRPGKDLLLERARLKAAAVDFMQGIPDLLAFIQSSQAARRLQELSKTQLRIQRRVSRALSFQGAATTLFSGLGMWTVLVLAIPLVETGEIQGVYLAVIALVVLTSFEAVQPLPLAAQTLSSDFQAASRLFEVIDSVPEVQDPPSPSMLPVQMDLSVRGLSFAYPGSELLLQDISFDLPLGKKLALVGPSGSGKSTLANLLLRLREVDAGLIFLGDQDIKVFSQESVRLQIGVVPQNVYLFNLSILENIRLGNRNADNEAVHQAARQASIHDFVSGLPEGYETWVGERGLQLSAGERQRVAIARALVKRAPLLILDEATANLDTITERRVLRSIFDANRNNSVLMIAHRLVGMEEMDEILVLDKGRVVERGSHAELLEANGIYRRMWELQRKVLM